MNGASDQPEEFGVQPEQGRQEEPQSNADSTSDATATSAPRIPAACAAV